jgi:hypothetical protein|tara:strand:- start:3525 stop:5426 length:1902 start_codon:yes stop_codon:yes gene_type:complete
MALPKQIRGKFLTDPEGKKFFRTTETGLEEVTKQSIGGGEVSGVGAEELASLRRGEVFAGGGLQTAFMPTFEQQHGTVAAVQQGKLDRAIRPDEIRMLRKAGISEAQLGGVKSDATFDQQFRARTGRFPTRAESIAGGQTVPQPTAPIGEGVAGLTNQEALARLKKEQENIAKYGTAIPTPDQIKAGPIVQPKIDTGVISKDTIGDTKKDKFVTPKKPTTTTGVFLTPEQQRQQKESDRALELSNKLAGERAEQKKQDKIEGITKKTALVTDLETEFEQVNNEANAIFLEVEKDIERGGVTTAIAGRMERARLRENTLKALNVSTRLNAARGTLKAAEARADQAVDELFDPIRDEYDAKIRNLEILSKSPKLTAEEKKQTADMKANLEAQKEKTDELKAIKLYNKKLTIEVIAENPDIDQAILDKIEAADSEIEAMKIAAPYLKKAAASTSIAEYEYAKEQGFTGTFQQWKDRQSRFKTGVDKDKVPTNLGEASRIVASQLVEMGTDLNDATYKQIIHAIIDDWSTDSHAPTYDEVSSMVNKEMGIVRGGAAPTIEEDEENIASDFITEAEPTGLETLTTKTTETKPALEGFEEKEELKITGSEQEGEVKVLIEDGNEIWYEFKSGAWNKMFI